LIFAKDDGPHLTDAHRTILDREHAEITHSSGEGITFAELKTKILSVSR